MELTNGNHPIPAGKIAAVVTHLEMATPPDTPPAPLPDGMALRRIERPDIAWYRDLYTRVGGLDWMWFSRLQLAEEDLNAILSDPDVEVYALEKEGRPEGLMELDFREKGSCLLAFLGLTATAQGSGAGRAMMAEAVARAFARDGVQSFRIHTCTFDSPVALPFYIRSGFAPVRREIEVVDDPRLDGTLPADASAHIPIIRP